MSENEIINIDIDRLASLVLFDWLGKIKPNSNIFIDDKIFIILSNIESSLESILDEPFKENYSELVRAARDKI